MTASCTYLSAPRRGPCAGGPPRSAEPSLLVGRCAAAWTPCGFRRGPADPVFLSERLTRKTAASQLSPVSNHIVWQGNAGAWSGRTQCAAKQRCMNRVGVLADRQLASAQRDVRQPVRVPNLPGSRDERLRPECRKTNAPMFTSQDECGYFGHMRRATELRGRSEDVKLLQLPLSWDDPQSRHVTADEDDHTFIT